VARRLVLLTILAVLPLTLVACGGGGGGASGLFDVAGVGITFEYPADQFDVTTQIRVQNSSGSTSAAQGGVLLDGDNLIMAQRYDLRISVTQDKLANVKDEVDNVIGELAGKSVSGREVEYGGLPGYEYAIALKSPPKGQSRIAVLFDDRTEYLVNCQSTPEQRETLQDACQQALDTLKKK
jgi:hypothetical protein